MKNNTMKTKKFLCKICQANSTTNGCGVCDMCIENKITDGKWTDLNWEKQAREYGKNIPYKKEYDC